MLSAVAYFFQKLIQPLKFIILICLIISIVLTPFNRVNAKENDSSPKDNEIHARFAAVIDADTNRLLYGKNADTKAPMASTTKIMTLITALEICPDDYIATTSAYAASMPDVQLNAVKGEQFSIKDLYYSLMLRSHNDTAVIIAENTAYYYICSLTDKERNELTFDISFINDYSYNSHFIENISKEQSKALVLVFTNLMNRKATSLGCNSTHYITPNGLDASDDADIHSTTAYELAVVMSYCIKNEHFLSITQTHDYSFTSLSGRKYSVSNANAFLNMYDNIISGKTGFTGDAGYCYVCAYRDNDRTFIVALLACGWPDNKTYKWSDAKRLLNYTRASYTNQDILICPKVFNIKIKNGSKSSIDILFDKKLSACISDNDNVEVVYNIPSSITAPVNNECIIGNVCVNINDKEIQRYNIYCNENIKKVSFISKITQKVKKL